MTDITFKLFTDHRPKNEIIHSESIKKSIDLVRFIKYFMIISKIQELSAIYLRLQLSLPSENIHDRNEM